MRCPVLAGSTTFQYYSQAPARSVSRQGVLRQSGTRKKEKMTTNLFRMTHFRKNASVTPFVSHTFKTTIRPGMVVLSEHRELIEDSDPVGKDPSELSKAFRLIHFHKNAS